MCLSCATSGRDPGGHEQSVGCLSSLFSWSVPRGWRGDNPCEHVRRLKGGEP